MNNSWVCAKKNIYLFSRLLGRLDVGHSLRIPWAETGPSLCPFLPAFQNKEVIHPTERSFNPRWFGLVSNLTKFIEPDFKVLSMNDFIDSFVRVPTKYVFLL
mmetsp:Transcript_89335/g.238891  ORF Transcript_89335/g.238891 Transcript_89335/m.238891 type:complete len:102 (+) Transcript_89335:984-1289(+)